MQLQRRWILLQLWYLCLRCLQREACLRSAACFSVLLRHECILWHDTLLYWSATYGGPFGCSGLLIWRLVSSVVNTCRYNVLLCTDTCWPACWTCTSLGQAAVAMHTRVCDCTHSTVTACLADQRAQDFCATMDRGSQPKTTSSANVSFNSQRIYNLMLEQFAQVLTLPDLSQFRF